MWTPGPLEIIIILVIVLVIFGPKRLPDLGRSLGRGMREFKDSVTGKDKEQELPEGRRREARADAGHRRQRRAEVLAAGGRVGRAGAFGPIAHEDRLSIVEHLDELRTPAHHLRGRVRRRLGADRLAEPSGPRDRQRAAARRRSSRSRSGPAEAFYTTLTNSAYAALLISLPVILYQLYAFLLPAFSPTERRVALPLLLLVPVLFITGVVFCYFVVLTPALDFLLNFNADEFNTQVRARDYYSFVTLLMLAMGIGFQIPVGVLAACKLGHHDAREAAQGPALRDRGDRRCWPRSCPRSTRSR